MCVLVNSCIDCTVFSSPLHRTPYTQAVTNNQCCDVGASLIEERKRSRLWCCTAAAFRRKHIVTGTYPVWYILPTRPLFFIAAGKTLWLL